MPVLDEAADRRLASLRDILSAHDADEHSVVAFYENVIGFSNESGGVWLPAYALIAYLMTGKAADGG